MSLEIKKKVKKIQELFLEIDCNIIPGPKNDLKQYYCNFLKNYHPDIIKQNVRNEDRTKNEASEKLKNVTQLYKIWSSLSKNEW